MGLDHLQLIVFDLDYTLWPFWVDTHVSPPFKKKYVSHGNIVDSDGSKITCYPEVPQVLEYLHDQGYILAVASRTSEIKGAKQLIQLFGWEKYFKYKEIFPGSKVTHFKNIKRDSGIEFDNMMFYDDEQRNIHDITKLGVLSILVREGVTKQVIKNGESEFVKRGVN